MNESKDVSMRLIGRLLENFNWKCAEVVLERYLVRCMQNCQRHHYKYEYILSRNEIKSEMLERGFYSQIKQTLVKLHNIRENQY